jgi:chaperonin GroES
MAVKAATSVEVRFTPLHDRVLIRRIEESLGYGEVEKTPGGIIIPDSAKREKPVYLGEVIAVGKGKSNDEGKVFPPDVKAGDQVVFGKYAGNEIRVDGEDYFVVREEEILGIVKK